MHLLPPSTRPRSPFAVALSALTMAATMGACLSKPPAPGGGTDDGGIGADASATCAPALPAAALFVAGTTVFGTRPKVADLNSDCLQDLVVPVRLDNARTGIFLIFGRPSNFLEGYDVLLEVSNVPELVWEPLAIEIADATGDGVADLLVLGVEPATAQAVLVVYVGDADASNPHPFTSAPLVRRTNGTYLIANSTTGSHEPAYVMAGRQDPGSTNGVVFGASTWAVSLSLPQGAWNQSALNSALLVPVAGLDSAGILGMTAAHRESPDGDGLLAVSHDRMTAYVASDMEQPGGSFSPSGTGIQMTATPVAAVVARGEAGLGHDAVLWSVGETTLRYSAMRWLSATTAGQTFGWTSMPADYTADSVRNLAATNLVGSPSAPEILVMHEIDPSGTRLRVMADIAPKAGEFTRPGGASVDLPVDYQRLVTGNFTATESQPAQQIWVLPSTFTEQAPPLCWTLLPISMGADDYCFAPCGASAC